MSLIRRRPVTVVIWGLLLGALFFLALLLFAPMLQMIGAKVLAKDQTPPDFALLAQLQASSALFNIGSFFVRAVIMCAVFRAVLRPEAGAFAFMRVGIAELFMAVFLFGGGIALGFLIVLVAAPFILAVVLLAVAHNVGAAVAVGIVGVIVILVVAIWLALRLSLLGPMIVDSGEFPLGKAWALTRGKVGSLFLIGLVVTLIVFGLEVLFFGITGILGFGFLSAVPHDPESVKSFFNRPLGALVAGLAPVLVLGWLVWSVFIGAVSAIVYAPWAEAYRQLAPAREPGAIA